MAEGRIDGYGVVEGGRPGATAACGLSMCIYYCEQLCSDSPDSPPEAL